MTQKYDYDPFEGVPPVKSSPYSDFLGAELLLPDTDLAGARIDRTKPHMVLALDCGTCGDVNAFLETLRAAPDLPVIVVSQEAMQLPLSIRSAGGLVSVVDLAACKSAPDELLDWAPIAFVVQGEKIVRVQGAHEMADTFLLGGLE
jgi:hypothetical protein